MGDDLCLPRPSAAPQTAPTADTRAPQQLASSAAIMLENAAKRTGEVSEVDGGEDAVHLGCRCPGRPDCAPGRCCAAETSCSSPDTCAAAL